MDASEAGDRDWGNWLDHVPPRGELAGVPGFNRSVGAAANGDGTSCAFAHTHCPRHTYPRRRRAVDHGCDRQGRGPATAGDDHRHRHRDPEPRLRVRGRHSRRLDTGVVVRRRFGVGGRRQPATSFALPSGRRLARQSGSNDTGQSARGLAACARVRDRIVREAGHGRPGTVRSQIPRAGKPRCVPARCRGGDHGGRFAGRAGPRLPARSTAYAQAKRPTALDGRCSTA